ncbi:MAG: HAMP domain-containing histidine kinase [Candidatus Marinimicrobia bacterium]|jgi:two-component system, OmpR family, sensor kinase|nr:HAMP domain-containing histidine kinase [Candidatus Neomarinimicrobiota bacterium]MBT3576690.1 HAMP domain-containing histidine kinase [Candidatus Neomarinimicrobiota bacterium]MBT3680162.1 HAMP domain-containing histidine kinase [Candidatus Neomarinimicrobiota bacterium]MBT4132433.1 HAMP domain-containing histidine kinase [Candidatus Neomarinimicrobiota bacterium]MBT4253125.1 HAMP domain-containing histidine kinase [Candidatus Neomarinimicrobiota bacterium]
MKLRLPNPSIRFKIIFAQAASLAGILFLFTFILSILLNQVLNMNLDRFLHMQSDNFQATISIQNGRISFHDLHSNFEHSGTEEDEIPFYVQFLDSHGRTLMLSGNLEERRLYHGGKLPPKELLETVFFFGEPSRRLITPVHIHNQHIGWLIVTIPFDYLDDFKDYKNRILFITGSIGILLFILLSFFFVKLALRPVKQLANSAEVLAEESEISALPDFESNDEIGDLTRTLNHLLRKAGQSMETLELFAANVSHELKTPLAIMHSEISLLQKNIHPTHQYSLDLLSEEVDRMQTLIENLLVISNSQRPYKLLPSDIWLQDFISDESGRIQRIFRNNNMHFDFSKVQSTKVHADIYLLQLVFDNLVRNAVLYSPENTTISISTTADESGVSIHVCDTGPGIAEAELAKILEPFVRGESTVHQAMTGSGLGLSISTWATQLLGGALKLENISPHGLKASITLPNNHQD